MEGLIFGILRYVVNMKRHGYGVIENDADITRLICRLDDISSYFNRRQPWGQSEPRIENEKFRFVSIKFQFVTSSREALNFEAGSDNKVSAKFEFRCESLKSKFSLIHFVNKLMIGCS